MAGTKFYGSTSTFLLSVAAFISLSGNATANDARQCYWCGPLAEQVHRSRRAPPCDAPKAHMTTCDPGFLHCAIVATAPPYTESRYCVKIYQDECYSDYCNSTKTWKMTCPCKGDLCNGQNSERDEKAFTELIEKTQKPIKKRTKKSIDEDPTSLTPTDSNENNISFVYTNLPTIEIKHNDDNTNELYEKEFITHIKLESTVDKSDLTQLEREEFVTTNNFIGDNGKYKRTMVHNNDDTTVNDIGQTDSTMLETTPSMLDTTLKITNINKNKKPISDNLVKSSEKLPTAEALQESANSNVANENHQEITTLSDDIVITTESTETTTENATSRKNSAIRFKSLHLGTAILFYITVKLNF